MSPTDETPQDRVRTALLCSPGQIVSTQALLRVAFGDDLPQGAILKLSRIISDLIADEEPIERTKWGCRIVLPCEADAIWASAGFVAHLRDRGAVQADLFGEMGP